ncbi:MAG: hypothetical protein LBV41_01740 [Cytophagaceae bacterium]|nr:hypothetical protein [Cytophagaceae bacterium]
MFSKYLNSATAPAAQNLFKGGHQHWASQIRGYASKEGATGLPAQHHGGNIATLPP